MGKCDNHPEREACIAIEKQGKRIRLCEDCCKERAEALRIATFAPCPFGGDCVLECNGDGEVAPKGSPRYPCPKCGGSGREKD